MGAGHLGVALLAVGIFAVNLFGMEAAAMERQEARKAEKIVQTAGRDRLGDFAPDFARYNDDILFGEVWSRNDILSLHDRSIVTISALVGAGVIDSSLKYHIMTAKKNGVTKDEMVEIITQLGFYAGWPKAWAAFGMAKEVYQDEPAAKSAAEEPFNSSLDDIRRTSLFGVGPLNSAYAQYFDGDSYLSMLTVKQAPVGNVTFAPGCRNHWHIHHADKGGGQILIATVGRGYYQEWGKPPQELRQGDVVNIPANVKHWHGAAPKSAFQHLAIEVPGESTSTEWCEPVDSEMYDRLK